VFVPAQVLALVRDENEDPDVSARPTILVANDDGIRSNGIQALARRLEDLGEVIVVAPDRERSAQSHAFTLDRPLRCEEIEPRRFMVDGTPADCVYIGLYKLCPTKPSLVVSGINHGYNLGSDVFYSGTVAGAVEAALRDVPAMAVSLEWSRTMREDIEAFRTAADFVHALARATLAEGLPSGTLLNVNVPQQPKPRGYAWTRLGKRVYRDQVDERKDLRGRQYYWIGGPPEREGATDVPGSDLVAVARGLVSVSPLGLDLTHHDLLGKLPGWHIEGFEAVVADDLRHGGGR
jgi:5'-nucleotidase